MQTLNHKQQAEQEAIRLAIGKLAALGDWPARCRRLGLPDPATTDGAIRIDVLGMTLEFRAPEFQAVILGTGKPPKPADHLLALHYLLGEVPVSPTKEWITFREFPGGQFYWEPFLSRSIKPLIGRMGNDLGLLKEHLSRFAVKVESLSDGGIQAVAQALGAIELMLVYRPGDDEFPASADVLFDSCARRVLCAEDAAALASRFCIGLLQGPVVPPPDPGPQTKSTPPDPPAAKGEPRLDPSLRQARLLIRDYRKQCGFSAAVTDAQGSIQAGTLDCGGCSATECKVLCRRIVAESLRWGAPTMDLCPRGRMLWGVPLMVNQRLVGGAIAAGRAKGKQEMSSVRAAADALLAMVEKRNLTNAALLATHRAKAERERQKAEAIHDAKGTDYDHIRAVYLQEEPALIAAIRKGERGAARGIINRVLVGIYFLGRDRIDLLKSLVMELVVMMSRAAVEAGASPAEILGGNYRGLNELAVIRDDETLTHWVADMLERLMDAIHDNRRYPNTLLLKRALGYMQEHLMEELTRDQVAKVAGLSPSHFSHLVREQLNSSFTELLVGYRVDHAARLLVRTTSPIAEVAQDCGFTDQSYFTKVFKKRTGQTPLAYRRQIRIAV